MDFELSKDIYPVYEQDRTLTVNPQMEFMYMNPKEISHDPDVDDDTDNPEYYTGEEQEEYLEMLEESDDLGFVEQFELDLDRELEEQDGDGV